MSVCWSTAWQHPLHTLALSPSCSASAQLTDSNHIQRIDCRREERQEARGAKSFEAACQAKALVKTWKKPHLSPGQTSLPVELWGLVLQQLLTEDVLWDLPVTAQELCNISLTSKGLYAAVQQQGWPKLCCLLKPLRPPAAVRGGGYGAELSKKCQLPADPDVVVTNPASLAVPELKAACAYYRLTSTGTLHAAILCCMQDCLVSFWQPWLRCPEAAACPLAVVQQDSTDLLLIAGTKAELMVRILARFGLSHPCSAPSLVVAYSRINAMQLLSGIHAVWARAKRAQAWGNHTLSSEQISECQQLYTRIVENRPEEMVATISRAYINEHLSTDMKHLIEAEARLLAPRLAAAFGSLKVFLEILHPAY